MSGLSIERLIFDPSNPSDYGNVGAYLRDAAGNLLTSTLVGGVGGKQALDVNVVSAITVAVDLDGVYNVTTNPTPDSVGNIYHVRAATPAITDQTLRTTGGAATSDGVVAANVHGQDVNSFLMGYNGATWDRLLSTSGALNVNISANVTVIGNVADDGVDSGNPIKVGSRAVSGLLTAVSATNDRADAISDMYRRIYINDSPNIALKQRGVTVGVTAVQIDTTPLAGRRRVLIQNMGGKNVYIGTTTVTTSGATQGLMVGPQSTLALELGQDVAIYAISGTAGQTVILFEVA